MWKIQSKCVKISINECKICINMHHKFRFFSIFVLLGLKNDILKRKNILLNAVLNINAKMSTKNVIIQKKYINNCKETNFNV